MPRILLAAFASAAIALSPAAPAKAEGGGELLGLLLGIGTVYAIGKGIEQARTPLAAPEVATASAPGALLQPADWRADRPRLAPGYSWNMPRRTLPRDCLSTFDTWHGEIRGFSETCLARTMGRPERLPAMCGIDTRIRQHETRIYSARCLQLEGWEIGRGEARWREPAEWPGRWRSAP